tara:strand:- start:207 stop:347 length:141 start_codon:yes stop_codon:yes gene_type:complete
MAKKTIKNIYRTPVRKRTSIGMSSTSRPKNKNARRLFGKKYRGQGK